MPVPLPFQIVIWVIWLTAAIPSTAFSEDSPAVRDKTFYGINADPVWNFQPDALPHFSEMLQQSGCGAIRIPIRWRVLEPTRGAWDYSALDRALDAIPQDVEILGTILSVPQWANGADPKTSPGWFDAYPPRDLADWKHAVSTIVSHYRHRIRHWEIWNEQNGVDFYRPRPDARAYTELLKTAYQAAKEADPDCVVVLGGLQMNGIIANPWSDVKVVNYLEDLYQAGARPFFDVCNIHPYALPAEGATRTMDMARDTLSVMQRHGDAAKPLWITEVGCGARTAEEEREQAKLLSATFNLAAREPRIHRVYWFLLRDMAKDLLGPESSMGLYKHNGTRKSALQAFREVSDRKQPR